MEKWFVQAKKADFEDWSRRLGIDVVTARILRNRDIMTAEEAQRFLGGSLNELNDPFLMKDMDRAAAQLLKAVAEGKKIRVIGDYDVDGVTSAFILTKGIRCLGGDVSTAIPHRIHDGYGLNDNLVYEASKDGVQLIVTCDNGISAAPQTKLAKSLGMDVIVTDHHEVPFETDGEGRHIQLLPEALAVVDPKRDDCGYPFKGICGAMVAYKLMGACLSLIKGEKTDIDFPSASYGEQTGRTRALEASMDELLEFAALGTVCDVMELKDENRIVVREGIKRMGDSSNVGLRALMEVNGISPEKLSAYHLGFVIGPCINASGRLDTALRAFELLNAASKAEALTVATDLKALNDSRKNLTNEGIASAEKYIKEHTLTEKKVWLIYLPEVHESIAGIIAGKIREKYNHPVFVLTRGEEGIKGSGRSIESYHMQAALMSAAGLLDKFGGHAMAAGLSLKEENLGRLDEFLNREAKLGEEDFYARVSIDVPMPMDYATLKLAREFERLEPFGTGNPHPLFAMKNVEFVGIKRFGSEGKYARYTVIIPGGKRCELTSFEDPAIFLAFLDEKYGVGSAKKLEQGKAGFKMSVAYTIDINRYRGNENLQFMLKHYC
ncbi:MAG: single-stranded-DNA-specific exonuclease RecJ [Lachnospiraceae bacterium]|nr:single-stranded-DNA-specific exonuclease RecJ [Lachnospiraceae bacterium]